MRSSEIPAQSPTCKDGNEAHWKGCTTPINRKVKGQKLVCVQNTVEIAQLKISLHQYSQVIQ